MKSLGIDLAGSPRRHTGAAVLGENMEILLCRTVLTDEDIARQAESFRPDIIAVDAPLSLPPGRDDIEKKTKVHLRSCDRELLSRKIKFFPVTLGPMRMLTARGMRLKAVLERGQAAVIEVYPGAAQDVLGLARQKEPEKLRAGLMALGIKNVGSSATVHELDALTAAYVGMMHLKGETESLGDENGGGIIMPLPRGGVGQACRRSSV